MRALLANRARREDARVVENVAVRHRAIDDVILRHCAPEDGIRQVVSINGGLDTEPTVSTSRAWLGSTSTSSTSSN